MAPSDASPPNVPASPVTHRHESAIGCDQTDQRVEETQTPMLARLRVELVDKTAGVSHKEGDRDSGNTSGHGSCDGNRLQLVLGTAWLAEESEAVYAIAKFECLAEVGRYAIFHLHDCGRMYQAANPPQHHSRLPQVERLAMGVRAAQAAQHQQRGVAPRTWVAPLAAWWQWDRV